MSSGVDDQVLGCPSGAELAFAGPGGGGGPPRLGCLARAAPVAVVGGRCPAGAIALAGRCVPILAGATRDLHVDVVRWMQGVVGPGGGPGASPLCDALARTSGALAGPPLAGAQLAVSLVFPDNDVSQVLEDATALSPSGAPDADATVELTHVVASLVEALRSLGGTASQATIASVVSCGPVAGRGPQTPGAGAVERPAPENDDGR